MEKIGTRVSMEMMAYLAFNLSECYIIKGYRDDYLSIEKRLDKPVQKRKDIIFPNLVILNRKDM